VTLAEIIRRVRFALELAAEFVEAGEHERAHSTLVNLFYDLDEWLMQLGERAA
jgi:hypothetical protein